MITTQNDDVANWPKCISWLAQFVPSTAFHIVSGAPGLHVAIEGLRVAHTTIDGVTKLNLNSQLFKLTLQVGEIPLLSSQGLGILLPTWQLSSNQLSLISWYL